MNWNEYRAQHLLDPEQIYLNTGSFGALHRSTFEALTEGLREVELNPTLQHFAYVKKVDVARARVAGFLGSPAEDIAFTSNVTVSMNMAILGLDWQAGDEIVASDLEYGAINNCMHHAQLRHGIVVRRAHIPVPPPGPEAVVAAFAEAMTPKTRLLVCSHICSRTGTIMPIAELANLAHEQGAKIAIDGAHAAGMIDVALADSGCDLYGGNCHKWLCSPKGVGFFYARPETQPVLHHIVVGWGYSQQGTTTAADGGLEIGGRPFMWGLEQWGSRDLPSLVAAATAVDVQEEIGPARIRERGRELTAIVRQQLEGTGLAECLTCVSDDMSGSLTAYHLRGLGDVDLQPTLRDRYSITIPAARETDGHWMRVSTHYYNTEDEIASLMGALNELRQA